VEGFVRSSSGAATLSRHKIIATFQRLSPLAKQAVLYSVSFGLVYLVAQTNPKGFVIVLEYFTSFALNVEAGIFIALMLGYSRENKWQQYTGNVSTFVSLMTVQFHMNFHLGSLGCAM
jgi:hypothetical protein